MIVMTRRTRTILIAIVVAVIAVLLAAVLFGVFSRPIDAFA